MKRSRIQTDLMGNQEITMVEKSAMTKKSIFEMLEGFSKYYDVMSPEDKGRHCAGYGFIHRAVSGEKRDDKHLIKTIISLRSP